MGNCGSRQAAESLPDCRRSRRCTSEHPAISSPLAIDHPSSPVCSLQTSRCRLVGYDQRIDGRGCPSVGLVASTKAGELPFGFQKRVEFARALAAQPRLLLLDEPAAGLNHEELADLANLIKWVRDEIGITVLLVEHHMQLVMDISDWIVVLNFGKKIAEGTPETIQNHPEVIRAYLGGPSV